MKKRSKKLNRAMEEKISAGQFFKTHLDILKELYHELPMETSGIILLSLLSFVMSYTELRFLEFVTNSASHYLSGADREFANFAIIVAAFLVGILILRLISNFNSILRERYQSKIVFRSEKKLINKLSAISYEYYESNKFHEKINLAQGACWQYAQAVYGVTEIFRIAIMLIVYGIILSRINIWFMAIIIVAIIISSVIAANVTDKQLDYWRTHVSPESRREYYFSNVFGNRVQQAAIQTGRAFPFFSRKYTYYNNRERKNYLKLNTLSFSSELSTSLLFLITFGATAIIVGNGVATGKFELGYYSMVIAMVASLFSTVKSFSMTMMNGNWYVRVMNAYYEVLNFDDGKPRKEINTDSTIALKNIRYMYPQSDKLALSGITADFKQGEKIALVGLNGSGKTTMISVILGLLENYEGIYSSNNAVATAVLQDFGQYQLSVKENLEIGVSGSEITDERAWDIIKAVGLEETIEALPNGIHTKLGQLEGGVELSKGQWQRLAIGRLLANEQANVWILDEPTAYLDPISEVKMYRFIFSLAGNRLVFFISHRLGFAKQADRIVVVDGGKIVEDGTHTELIQKNGIYAEMFVAQKEWYA